MSVALHAPNRSTRLRPSTHRADEQRRREHHHQQVQQGALPDRLVETDRRRVRRVLQERDHVERQEHSARQQHGQQPRRQIPDAAVRHAVCHREQRAHRDAERQHAEAHADVGLHAAGEQFDPVLVAGLLALPRRRWPGRSTGSTNVRANTNAATLAIAPANRPRAIIRFSIVRLLRSAISGRGSRADGGRRARTRE